MPYNAQFSSFKTATVIDANGDDLPDVFIAGNFYDNNIQMGRLDADYGTILINKGQGNFEVSPLNGLSVKGQVRSIKKINIKGKEALVLARNSDTLKIIQFDQPLQ